MYTGISSYSILKKYKFKNNKVGIIGFGGLGHLFALFCIKQGY